MLEYGVSSAQFLLMQYLDNVHQATVSKASGAMGVTPGAITSLSERLVSAGYLKRERDNGDRRMVWLMLTPKGERILGELQNRRRQLVMYYLSDLSEQEIENLVGMVRHLARVIERKPPLTT